MSYRVDGNNLVIQYNINVLPQNFQRNITSFLPEFNQNNLTITQHIIEHINPNNPLATEYGQWIQTLRDRGNPLWKAITEQFLRQDPSIIPQFAIAFGNILIPKFTNILNINQIVEEIIIDKIALSITDSLNQFFNVPNQLTQRIKENSEKFYNMMEFLLWLVGRDRRYQRLFFSCWVYGITGQESEFDMEEENQNIVFHKTYYGRAIGIQGIVQDVQDSDRQIFISDFDEFWQTLELENYRYQPIGLMDIQIFAVKRPYNNNNVYKNPDRIEVAQYNLENKNKQQIFDGNQRIAQFKQILKNAIFQKPIKGLSNRIQAIQNKFSTFKQRKDEPCLYTLYRYLTQIEEDWKIIKNKISIEQKQIIKQGKFEDFFDKIILPLNIDIEKLGIFILDTKRWINQKEEKQIVLIEQHLFISSISKIKRFLYEYIENQDNSYCLKIPTFRQQRKEKNKKTVIKLYFDIETYTINNSNEQKPYLVCFINEQKISKQFWGDQCLEDSLQWLLKLNDNKQNKKIEVWSFNGSKFDYLFYFDLIIKLNNQKSKIFGSPTDLKYIVIDKIFMYDLRLIFSKGSLKQQAKQWGIIEEKQEFDIANKNQQWFEDNKEKIIKYCVQDCIVLLQLVKKFDQLCNEISFNNRTFNNENIYSCSKLSQEVFQQLYLDEQIYGSYSRDIYDIEKSSYYGGMTQNLKKSGKNLYYYDINSSYPYQMESEQYPYQYEQTIDVDINNKNNKNFKFIDYYLYEIVLKFKNNVLIPFLPKRTKQGLYYCLTVEKSFRWGKELNAIQKYKLFDSFQVTKIVSYIPKFLFKSFINDMYNKRKEAKQQNRNDLTEFYKLIMNSLYGKFGQRQFDETTYVQFSNLNQFIGDFDIPEDRKFMKNNQNLLIKQINSLRKLKNDLFCINYLPNNQSVNFIGSLIRLASYTTALGRIKLIDTIQSIGENHIYYMDTDSIITDKQLSQNLIDQSKLGQWKLECEIQEGYFFAPKMYFLIKKNYEDYEFKAKGIKLKDFHLNDVQGFENLNFNEKLERIKDILIEKECITFINHNVFKRSVGSIHILDQQKKIKLTNSRRQWIENISYPLINI